MKKLLCFITFLLLSILVSCTSDTQDRTVSEQVLKTDKQFLLTYPNLENPGGEILLENEHVVLQRFIVGLENGRAFTLIPATKSTCTSKVGSGQNAAVVFNPRTRRQGWLAQWAE